MGKETRVVLPPVHDTAQIRWADGGKSRWNLFTKKWEWWNNGWQTGDDNHQQACEQIMEEHDA